MIDTQHTTDRRTLRFTSLDDLRADLDHLEDAFYDGCVRPAGNWTPAQVLNHLAAFINFAYDGYPPQLPPPGLIMRLFARLLGTKILDKGFPPGIRMPGIAAGTFGADDSPFEDALTRLRHAIDRLEASAPTIPNPVLGFLSHHDWIRLHLRHAELHLSFLHPEFALEPPDGDSDATLIIDEPDSHPANH
jgi:hypothetical protein